MAQVKRHPNEVDTRSGRLRGTRVGGLLRFLGVPYARPPVGELRFRGPQPVKRWKGVREARVAGPTPLQMSVPFFRAANAGAGRQSEDCLYLNVWTPGLDDARRPVFVWIHGGGFLVGAGSTPIYDGATLAARGDIVVVTINYRLGALGHVHLKHALGHDFKDAANAGSKDQAAALQWVQDNIEAFGGDPGNVTVAGQSAGAMSIGALLGSPMARGLFKRAILQSGAAHNVMSEDRAAEAAEVFLDAIGPLRDRRSLASVSTSRILRAQGITNRKLMNPTTLMVMTPCIDGEFITEHPFEAIERGALAEHELLIGTTLDEWKLFGTLDALAPSVMGEHFLRSRFMSVLDGMGATVPSPEQALNEYRAAVKARGGGTSAYEVWNAFQTTRVFHVPSSELAARHSAAGGKAYSYLFKWRPRSLRSVVGACHALDVPFVFGLDNLLLTRAVGSLSASAPHLSRRMQDAWVGFIRSGEPRSEHLPDWDTYCPEHRATMLLGRQCYVADSPLDGERELLTSWMS